MKRAALILISVAIVLVAAPGGVGKVIPQSVPRSLVGNWILSSSPINGEIISRKGNSLGFPERHMTFEAQEGLQTCFVDREDVSPDAQPLGVWRISGDEFSATFQLWCPEPDQPCGSVIMRGRFTDDNHIRGTFTVFFDEPDETRPTGFDTWVSSFRGERN